MEKALNAAISVGPIALAIGLLFAIVVLVIRLRTTGPQKHVSLLRYGFVVAAVGVVAFVAGTALGIAAFCSAPSASNLCGLGGVFGVGPFLSGICIATYSYFWLKATRRAA